MTKDHNQFRDDLPDDGAGWINRFLADEDQMDGRMMWRLASWGLGSVAALVVAILATRSPAAINRDQVAAAELTRQSQQVQWIAKESQNKARELAAAQEVERQRLLALRPRHRAGAGTGSRHRRIVEAAGACCPDATGPHDGSFSAGG